MGDVLFAVVAATLIVVATIALQISSWLGRRARLASEPYAFLCESHSFKRLSDQFVMDTRTIRYLGRFRGTQVRIEIGEGAGVAYARVHFVFDRDLQLGLRISSEREDSMMTRLMRMREVRIGLHHFDSEFILLSRNEGRLKQLLDHDVRRMLMNLRKATEDVWLDDDGLHVHVTGRPERQVFLDILEDGSQLAAHVVRRAEDVLAEEARENEQAEAPAPAFTPIPGTITSIGAEPPVGKGGDAR